MTERVYTMSADGTIISIALRGGVTVFAKPLEDFPIAGIYMTWAQGLIYLRCTDNGAEGVEIRAADNRSARLRVFSTSAQIAPRSPQS